MGVDDLDTVERSTGILGSGGLGYNGNFLGPLLV